MTSIFHIERIAFQVLGYPISYIEFVGTLFGLISVYYASRANILTWPTGIVNELLLFILFFQIRLYADMFLQVYFFVVTLYGWYNWNAKVGEVNISYINASSRWIIMIVVFIGALTMGFAISKIHVYLPQFFEHKASYPYIDSFIMVASIAATILLAKKKIENWYLWLAIDIVCVGLYFKKNIYFLSLEYLIFLGLVLYGWYNWTKQLKHG